MLKFVLKNQLTLNFVRESNLIKKKIHLENQLKTFGFQQRK